MGPLVLKPQLFLHNKVALFSGCYHNLERRLGI